MSSEKIMPDTEMFELAKSSLQYASGFIFRPLAKALEAKTRGSTMIYFTSWQL